MPVYFFTLSLRKAKPQRRHALRRRALSVPQLAQTMYIARAKAWVATALPPKIAAVRRTCSNVWFKSPSVNSAPRARAAGADGFKKPAGVFRDHFHAP